MNPTEPVPIPDHEWDADYIVRALRDRDAQTLLRLARKYGASQLHLSARVTYLTDESLTQNQISLIASGKARVEKLEVWDRIALALDMPDRARVILGLAPRDYQPRSIEPVADGLEAMRRRLADAFESFSMSETLVEDWEQIALTYGRATRHTPPTRLLQGLIVDFGDLDRQLKLRAPAQLQRRLSAVAAQLSGLVSLLLTSLCRYGEAQKWGRIARLAAREAADPALAGWVRAQDAYAAFWQGSDYLAAVDIAQHAQRIANHNDSVGVALAAAVEARAHAFVGDRAAAEHAIEAATRALDGLGPDSTEQSAFSYNEAQLRFHEGNALTHLGLRDRAWDAQRRALELYPTTEALDRTLIHLDRAFAFALSDEVEAAAAHAIETLRELPPNQRTGLVLSRTRQLVAAIDEQANLPITRDLRSLIAESRHKPRAISGG
jgi:hypothetical protein